MNKMIKSVCVGAAMALCGTAAWAEGATKDQAVAMVKKGVAHVKSAGAEGAYAEFSETGAAYGKIAGPNAKGYSSPQAAAAETTAAAATTEPDDRSMPLVMMTRLTPIAMMPMAANGIRDATPSN